MNGQLKVLVVDDDPSFIRLMHLYLTQEKTNAYEIASCTNVEEALAWIDRGNQCDVIILDYYLPEHTGDELARTLIEQGKLFPIICVTISKDFRIIVQAMKLGINDFLVKEEITPQVLTRTITNVIQRHKLHQELSSLEISSTRLEAIQELVVGISNNLLEPLDAMQKTLAEIQQQQLFSTQQSYIRIISDNIRRIASKIEKLKILDETKTVSYVNDIRMFDLS